MTGVAAAKMITLGIIMAGLFASLAWLGQLWLSRRRQRQRLSRVRIQGRQQLRLAARQEAAQQLGRAAVGRRTRRQAAREVGNAVTRRGGHSGKG